MTIPVHPQTDINFRFGWLEARLAEMHEIDSGDRTKFQARLKNLHRLGFPSGMNTSPGKATLYNEGQIVQMAIAVEMMAAGLSPERLIEVYRLNQYPILMAIQMGATALIAHPQGFDPKVVDPENDPLSMFVFFDPSGLADLRADRRDDEDPASESFFYGGAGIVAENIAKWTTGPATRRVTLINVTTMLWDLAGFMGEPLSTHFFRRVHEWANGEITSEDFDLDAWIAGDLWSGLASDLEPDPAAEGDPSLIPLLRRLTTDVPEDHLFHVPQKGDRIAPDAILHFPGQRTLSVDGSILATTPKRRLQATPALAVRERVNYLASQPYRHQFSDKTEWAVLYVPSAEVMDAVERLDPELIDWAFQEKKVVVVGPQQLASLVYWQKTAWDDDARRTLDEIRDDEGESSWQR